MPPPLVVRPFAMVRLSSVRVTSGSTLNNCTPPPPLIVTLFPSASMDVSSEMMIGAVSVITQSSSNATSPPPSRAERKSSSVQPPTTNCAVAGDAATRSRTSGTIAARSARSRLVLPIKRRVGDRKSVVGWVNIETSTHPVRSPGLRVVHRLNFMHLVFLDCRLVLFDDLLRLLQPLRVLGLKIGFGAQDSGYLVFLHPGGHCRGRRRGQHGRAHQNDQLRALSARTGGAE